jgi:hypothetical protein
VGKWACDKYEGFQNNEKVAEVCTVDPKALGFSAADFEITKQMTEFFKKMVPAGAARNGEPFTAGHWRSRGIQRNTRAHDQLRQGADSLHHRDHRSQPPELSRLELRRAGGFQKQEMFGGRGRGRGRGVTP